MIKYTLLIILYCCAFRSFAASPDTSNGTQIFLTAFTNATETLKLELATGREQRRTNAVNKIWRAGELSEFIADFCHKWPEERFVCGKPQIVDFTGAWQEETC
jgi:hypothetical protein